MRALIENQNVDLARFEVIGSGGEGLVVKGEVNGKHEQAFKIYHNPNKYRSRKLKEFFTRRWNLPTSKIALPQQPIYNLSKDLIVGITMPYLGSGFEEIALFSNRKRRLTYGITNKMIAEVFLDGYDSLEKIHKQGLIVGDLNDLNVLFRNREMLWIDVDAWQFSNFACPVATLDFLDPGLYGVDLSKRPVFKEENDWYSFAVMLFRSLLLTHPYGGVHKKFKAMQTRAINKVTVFDSGVMFPKIAFPPDVLSDDLANAFLEIFKEGKRKPLSKIVLQEYSQNLTECQNCHTFYPIFRRGCPVCNKRTLVIVSKPVTVNKNVRVTQMFITQGNIVYTKVQNNIIFVVTQDKNGATLHKVDISGKTQSVGLGLPKKVVRYAVGGDFLVVNPIHSGDLILIDHNQSPPQLVHKTVTEIFSPSRKAAFQVTGNKVIRVMNGNIMSIEKGGINVIEKYIRDGITNQTWFSANDGSEELQLFGLMQIFEDQRYWYHVNNKHFEPKIPHLNKNERLIDLSVRFSSDTVLLRRKTQETGTEYLRTEIVNGEGEIIHSRIVRLEDCAVKNIHGQTYSNGILIHATDDGLMQEKVVEAKFRTFSQTKDYVKEGDSIYKYRNGLLMAGENTITFLELTR
jgi:hypothetical protein